LILPRRSFGDNFPAFAFAIFFLLLNVNPLYIFTFFFYIIDIGAVAIVNISHRDRKSTKNPAPKSGAKPITKRSLLAS